MEWSSHRVRTKGEMVTTVLDRESPIPLYVQIEEMLREKIAQGEWGPGDRIPSETQLNGQLGVARMTLRGVLSTLVDEGLLYRVPGKGTFVSEDKIGTMSPAYRGIRPQLEEQGHDTVTRLVHLRSGPAPERVARHLGRSGAVLVHDILRVRSADGIPVSLHHSYVPVDLAPDLDRADVVAEQLCIVLERDHGLRAHTTAESLEAVVAREEEARLLDLNEGDPVLRLEDVIRDATGRVFEYSTIAFRGDRMKLHFRFTH